MFDSSKRWIVVVGSGREDTLRAAERSTGGVFAIVPPGGIQLTEQVFAKAVDLNVVEADIATAPDEATFWRYSLPGFDSLSSATGLLSLYPGLSAARTERRTARTLESVLDEAGISSSALTCLIIEYADRALELLRQWRDGLLGNNPVTIWVRTSPHSLYDAMPDHTALVSQARELGLDAGDTTGDDPAFFLQQFTVNPLFAKLQAAESAREIAESGRDAAQHSLDEARAQVEKQRITIERLREQLAAQTTLGEQSAERLTSLESRLEALFAEQKSTIQETSSALGQHVTRMSREQLDAAVVREYFRGGALPAGYAVATSFSRELLERIDAHRYGMFLVFGSAGSVELIGRAEMARQAQGWSEQNAKLTDESPANEQVVRPSRSDLPQRLMAFEHQRDVSETLARQLADKSLDSFASVRYAPWVEAGGPCPDSLFYACQADLERVRSWLHEDVRILVVVGSALAESGTSRSAALPTLLRCLPTHPFDIMLESSNYDCEAELAADWRALLDSRQRPHDWLHVSQGIGLSVHA